jgi:hypothetical protein
MSSTSQNPASSNPADEKVRVALNSRWETAAPVVYDGSIYSAWKEAIVRDFTIRRAKWILSGSPAGWL